MSSRSRASSGASPDPGGAISVVTPTLERSDEVEGLLENLAGQTRSVRELVLVDASPGEETREVVEALAATLPYRVLYERRGGGTAVQRNVGLDLVTSPWVAFIDDDIRLEADFFERILEVFADDAEVRVGGVTGYIENQFLDPSTSLRWRLYRALRLFTVWEPGRYDWQSGYPINRYLQPPHDGVREIDFMGAGCAVWRGRVFDEGLRFASFFAGHGVLEDAHLSLRAGRRWRLLECGSARCRHLRAGSGRESGRSIGRKSAVNYRYVFVDLVPRRRVGQELRFWRVQLVDLVRMAAYALRRPSRQAWGTVVGKLEGIVAAIGLDPRSAGTVESSDRDRGGR